jgi:hypothetical protein
VLAAVAPYPSGFCGRCQEGDAAADRWEGWTGLCLAGGPLAAVAEPSAGGRRCVGRQRWLLHRLWGGVGPAACGDGARRGSRAAGGAFSGAGGRSAATAPAGAPFLPGLAPRLP